MMESPRPRMAAKVPPAPPPMPPASAPVAPPIASPVASPLAALGGADLELPRMLERMHRRYLDILQVELKRLRVRDINPVQAFLLLDMGEEELTIQELIDRGYYVRSNALYNIKKLVDAGYFLQTRDPHDRRAMRIGLTDKARANCAKLREGLAALAESVAKREGPPPDYDAVQNTLRRLERAWDDYIRYGNL